ncbi:putative D,D-dipeptide-binding periplasmic protein DdpA precursor [Aquimixticola soesokkakensis]|uniref:Putative D,D-dipeptide-binding periplasmic protein DdpA n=1 Tax=Aquimixticola soesokkakensis TaxID=1519096 RepID=A0A1Y5RX32_9RHOB|nr:ABC transporter substrate-binding protein [Aquimixticola soesokkakensis]SLN27506.1 putative D,D-dipeptide-binding periplasmic protein DdpA precursor [Aquimixticola soesokkakensis]
MKHLLTSAALGALVLGAPMAQAQTPDTQLIAALNMNNVLTMDPAAITGGETVQILNNVYDTLVQLNPQTLALEPRLAESWDISDDAMSITFHLRPDLTFASGNPLTARDVAYSFKRFMTLGLAQASALMSRGFTAEAVDSAFQALDDQTFVMTLPQPDDPRLIMMVMAESGRGSILDSKLVQEHEVDGDWGQAWLTNNAAGSGAFTLGQWRSNEYVILEKNENFWKDLPAMERVLMRHLPESQSQRLALEQGDLDVGFSLAAADLKALAADEDITVETVPSAGFYYLAVSMKDAHFANAKVREALRYLIDYDGINTAIMPYFGVKRQRPINSDAFAVLPDPGYTLDVEKAKALLAEAGYPDGFDTTLRVISTQEFLDSATAIQNTLKQAGINAEIITGDGGQIYGAMRERSFELLVGRGGGGQQPHPDSNLRAMVYNPDNSDEAGLTNYQGWRTSFYDADLNANIEAALLEKDPDVQIALYEDIQNQIEEVVPSILPFSERVVTAAYQDDISGLIVNPWVLRFEDVTKSR